MAIGFVMGEFEKCYELSAVALRLALVNCAIHQQSRPHELYATDACTSTCFGFASSERSGLAWSSLVARHSTDEALQYTNPTWRPLLLTTVRNRFRVMP